MDAYQFWILIYLAIGMWVCRDEYGGISMEFVWLIFWPVFVLKAFWEGE